MFRRSIINNLIGAIFLLTIGMGLFAGCKNAVNKNRDVTVASYEIEKETQEKIITGADRVAMYYPMLKGKRVACVVNHTSMVGENHLVDTLLSMGVDLKKVFAPEHGFRGDKADGEKVGDEIADNSGLSIISLYGKNRKPSIENLNDIDVVIYDIQDVGARFYTYLSTLHYILEACGEQGKKLIVLDRPNPNGHYIDGPVLKKEYSTFVGLHPVPVVYGMTIGEYAKMINGEGWLADGVTCQLDVIELKNYNHNSYYELPIPPSPNLPNLRSILLYPSLCFFEGTTVSVGRGTDKQFQVLGHPSLVDRAFSFIPKPNIGSKFPPQEGKKCFGEDLSLKTSGSLKELGRLDLSYLLKYHKLITEKEELFFLKTNHFTRLAGGKSLEKMIASGNSETEIRESWQEDLTLFKLVREKYLIYP